MEWYTNYNGDKKRLEFGMKLIDIDSDEYRCIAQQHPTRLVKLLENHQAVVAMGFEEMLELDVECNDCGKAMKYREYRRGRVANHHYSDLCVECERKVIEKHTFICFLCGNSYHRARECFNIGVCQTCQSKDVSAQGKLVSFHNNRARKVGKPATLTLELWLSTLDKFARKCAYCQGPYEVLEHFIPLSIAGTTAYNCVPSCYSCNSRKKDRLADYCFDADVISTVKAYLEGLSSVA